MSRPSVTLRRLIEVDLPIKRISAHARREKSIRHGHISTMHLWWARRPLAACRAVILGALWPDPADPSCPASFRVAIGKALEGLRNRVGGAPRDWVNPLELREACLEFIADFSNWDLSTQPDYNNTARAITAAAHAVTGDGSRSRPLLIDPFAGGGAIPLEGLRCGAEVFASDLNPLPALLNRVVLQDIPRYGERLATAVREEGARLREAADRALRQYYPSDPDGSVPLAYLWARTVRCEGPACGAEIPLLRTKWLAKRGEKRSVAFVLTANRKERTISFEIKEGVQVDPRDAAIGTIARGTTMCPLCGFSMKVAGVRAQLRERRGGASDARLLAVVLARPGVSGRHYRLPCRRDTAAVEAASAAVEALRRESSGTRLSWIPEESTAHYHSFVNRGPIYGMNSWSDYYTSRQQLALGTMVRLAAEEVGVKGDPDFARAVQTCVALALSRQVDATSSLCRWHVTRELHTATFGRQALPMVWDFSEVNVLSEATGGLMGAIEWVARVCSSNVSIPAGRAQVELASATKHPLPDDSAQLVVTDPPYYFSVQYADLADYFYVWLRRSLGATYPDLFATPLIEKQDEIIVQSPGHVTAKSGKNSNFYEERMRAAMAEARRVVAPDGIGVIVFAHKSTAGWEAQLQSMIDAGWVITASWPIDTEMGARVIAQGRAVLASSIHLVCRPREHSDGSVRTDDVGDWRQVLANLRQRTQEWMPRLASEGVAGADAIFACLGPALEVFSRYSRVEKSSGEQVALSEYLEQVWSAVAQAALALVFREADSSSFEEDARLTAMWLWTIGAAQADADPDKAGDADEDGDESASDDESDEDDGATSTGSARSGQGYSLEFDAARKIAQGLGIELELHEHLVEVGSKTARLRSVQERTKHLFREGSAAGPAKPATKKKRQIGLFTEFDAVAGKDGQGSDNAAPTPGGTTLDRLQQAMILFATGRADALKRFLVDDGAGSQRQFWTLAQALSALYPTHSEEKRWVDGVLARKKGLGF